MTFFIQVFIEGIALGAVYSLVALGFVIIFKATDVLSFAQPALAALGAGFICYFATEAGINFWLSLLIGIILTGLIGLIIERTVLRQMVGEPVFSVAVITIGVDILIRTFLDNWIGDEPRFLGDSFTSYGNFGSFSIGDFNFKYLEMAGLFVAFVVILLLNLFFKKSRYGLAMLATSFDQETALAQGINVGRVFGLAWFIGGLLAAIAGFVFTGGFNTLTQLSFVLALRALPAVVIGGLDSIPGAIVGSLIIGVTQSLAGYYQYPMEEYFDINLGLGFSTVAPYIIMFFILLVKPEGLFGTKEVERV